MDTVTLWLLIFVVGALGLFAAFIIEVYEVRKQKESFAMWEELVSEYIDGFNEIKTVINGNADVLRKIGEKVNEHDRTLKVAVTIIDVHSEVLKINPKLREELESIAVDGYVMDFGGEPPTD